MLLGSFSPAPAKASVKRLPNRMVIFFTIFYSFGLAGSALNPAWAIAWTIFSGETLVASYCTTACLVAKLTCALITAACFFKMDSMLSAHAVQSIAGIRILNVARFSGGVAGRSEEHT